MITPCQMYWVIKLDAVCTLFFLLGFGSLLASLITVIVGAGFRCKEKHYSWETKESVAEVVAAGKRLHRNISRPCLIVGLVALVLATLIPTTKQMATIIVVPKLVNSEKVQMAGNKLYDLAVEWMDELKPRKDGAKEAK